MELQVQFDLQHCWEVLVAWAKQQAEAANLRAYQEWTAPNGPADGWRNQAGLNRERGLPLPPKPVPPLKVAVIERDGALVEERGPARIAPEIPDLNPLPTGGVGSLIEPGPFYRALPGDTKQDGEKVEKDGVQYERWKRFIWDCYKRL